MLCYAVLCNPNFFSAMLYYTILYYTILRYAICDVMCYAMLTIGSTLRTCFAFIFGIHSKFSLSACAAGVRNRSLSMEGKESRPKPG
ncbi:hypothetical protein F5B22DRAFT_618746 [Xylaria bambusicola]|uniref:uncharacterized protein n=1 Tax=Xylaria bambusicola TaxID=326684 RepID=UPI0020072BFC|nr:uncharacterized protein F5B22DRAFT_618746 [Xylaria bambusicola]KAI0508981.1 hypothetical protein F5B22DRAFT_618746 [Xylaria bambusicola]